MYSKSRVFVFFEKNIKKPPRDLPRGGKMEAKIPLGAPQDAEKWSQNFSGGPPAKTSEFCFGPGGLQERSGIDFYSKKVVLKSPLTF